MQHSQPRILINQISYNYDQALFQSLSLAFGNEKTGLTGRNGTGKSTLLKLIMGELAPHSGSIQIAGTVAYCPQITDMSAVSTVNDLLGLREKLDALDRIALGSIAEQDFQTIGDDWDLPDRIKLHLAEFGLQHIRLAQPLATLSGGELTRLLLARIFFTDADFIILDEPTNNLDMSARAFLYAAIAKWEKGLLVVSHDRTLLNYMDRIIELTSLGAVTYGGNYDHYHEQKTLQRDAAEREVSDAKKALNKTRVSTQTTRERHEQKSSQGRKLFLTGKIDKLFARAQQGRSEKTHGRTTRQADNQIDDAEQKVKTARAKIEVMEEIMVSLPDTSVPNGKIILDMEKISFSHDADRTLIKHFNLRITGPERVALTGGNGSGKSTLIKLILGELQPQDGLITLGTQRISYLDQHTRTLNPYLSIVDNFLQLNPEANSNDAHAALARFLFRNNAALKLVRHLSGGEKLRAELACAFMAKQPPQLLILDEPTNHLDLASIASIESALKNYQGAMIVISHDERFLEEIGIGKFVQAPFIV